MPRILEKHVVGHVTKGIEEEASKSWRCRVGGGVGTCGGDWWVEKRKGHV